MANENIKLKQPGQLVQTVEQIQTILNLFTDNKKKEGSILVSRSNSKGDKSILSLLEPSDSNMFVIDNVNDKIGINIEHLRQETGFVQSEYNTLIDIKTAFNGKKLTSNTLYTTYIEEDENTYPCVFMQSDNGEAANKKAYLVIIYGHKWCTLEGTIEQDNINLNGNDFITYDLSDMVTNVEGENGIQASEKSKGVITISHTNSIEAKTDYGLYPIKIDAQGHISAYDEKVEALKNPQPLKFQIGNTTTKSYDGSGEIIIKAADLGLGNAIHFVGVTTSSITDGSSTRPTITGLNNYTPSSGDIVIRKSNNKEIKEFIWTETGKWEELGDESAYLPLTGGTLTGNVTFTKGDLTLYRDPQNSKHAATKNYVDNKYKAGDGLSLSSGSQNKFNVKYGKSAKTACEGNDTRLSDERNAKDVYAWAKASTKPTYTYTEVGAAAKDHNHDTIYSKLGHTHIIADITNLQNTLNSKLPLSGGTMTGNLILSDNPTADLQAATKQYVDTKKHSAADITSGTLDVARGGTGKTTLKDAANSLINGLDTGSATPLDTDYYISQFVGGGDTTITYHRRPMSALYSYIKRKTDSLYLGITATAADAEKLDGKDSTAFATSTHDHDARYALKDHIHTTYAALSHNHTKAQISDFNESDYATASHTHTRANITDFAHTHTYNELTNKPVIPTITVDGTTLIIRTN